MTNLDKAIIIAVEAHQGQNDKAGKPYVFHPLRLMLKQDTPEAMIAAMLHDVVEDRDFTLDQVAEAGFYTAVQKLHFSLDILSTPFTVGM